MNATHFAENKQNLKVFGGQVSLKLKHPGPPKPNYSLHWKTVGCFFKAYENISLIWKLWGTELSLKDRKFKRLFKW